MMTPLFHVTLPDLDENTVESHFAPLVPLLEGMIGVNQHHISRSLRRAHAGIEPPIPPLFASGVRYREDPPGQENWRDALAILARRPRTADCDQIISWRVAELREAGIAAEPVIKWQHLPHDLAVQLGYGVPHWTTPARLPELARLAARRGHRDLCERLCATILQGTPPPIIPQPGLWLVHCCVRLPNGLPDGSQPPGGVEDTSKLLGMGGNFTSKS